MLVTAITFSFQIIASKFIARTPEADVRSQIYTTLLRRAWQVGLAIGLLIAVSSSYLKSYLNLPSQIDVVLLAIAAAIYIPVGVQRGRMQGGYNFSGLAINVVVEAAIKLGAALLFLHLQMGVTGVMTAVLLSIVAAYLAGEPAAKSKGFGGPIRIAPFGEGVQAVLYFAGQVILSNLDILLVKHFFLPAEAGIYAAVALVGRVVFMLSWSVVSSMFPVSASRTQPEAGRPVLYTALLLVGSLTSVFVAAIALAPQSVWTVLLGNHFLFGVVAPFSSLLTQYAVMTGIYCVAVVIMMYEISRRIGTVAWLQLGASIILTAAIWRYHQSLSQVIFVQLVVMSLLLLLVTVPLFRARDEESLTVETATPVRRLRNVPEAEVIAEFLRGEFYHPEYDSYRVEFQSLVETGDFADAKDASVRRALLFRRRGPLWRELPADTHWFEIELTAEDLSRLRSFPRNEWRRFTGGAFHLLEMVGLLKTQLARGETNPLLVKLDAIGANLQQDRMPDVILLIGVDESQEFTIIEGNHRMAAALLTIPDSAHSRFRFYCGLSPNMNSCCWHKTTLRSITRFARHSIQDSLHNAGASLARTRRPSDNDVNSLS